VVGPTCVDFHLWNVCYYGLAFVISSPAVVVPPSLTLVYYDGQGRAEISRLLFALGGIKYEDRRLTDVRDMPWFGLVVQFISRVVDVWAGG
jgi:hypothetical protein